MNNQNLFSFGAMKNHKQIRRQVVGGLNNRNNSTINMSNERIVKPINNKIGVSAGNQTNSHAISMQLNTNVSSAQRVQPPPNHLAKIQSMTSAPRSNNKLQLQISQPKPQQPKPQQPKPPQPIKMESKQTSMNNYKINNRLSLDQNQNQQSLPTTLSRQKIMETNQLRVINFGLGNKISMQPLTEIPRNMPNKNLHPTLILGESNIKERMKLAKVSEIAKKENLSNLKDTISVKKLDPEIKGIIGNRKNPDVFKPISSNINIKLMNNTVEGANITHEQRKNPDVFKPISSNINIKLMNNPVEGANITHEQRKNPDVFKPISSNINIKLINNPVEGANITHEQRKNPDVFKPITNNIKLNILDEPVSQGKKTDIKGKLEVFGINKNIKINVDKNTLVLLDLPTKPEPKPEDKPEPKPEDNPEPKPTPVPIDKSIKKINIFTSCVSKFAAENLCNVLNKMNIYTTLSVRAINNNDIKLCNQDPNLYLFIFSPQQLLLSLETFIYLKDLNSLPKNKYILYQIEQLNQNQYKYQSIEIIKDLVKNSYCTFDYSETNLLYYSSELKEKVRILKPFIKEEESQSDLDEKEIDILFMGTLNERRTKILDGIKNYSIENKLNYKIHIVEKVFGNDLIELLKKSKIVLNLHYFNSAILELFRIHDVIPYNCRIISEKPGDGDPSRLVEKYKNYVEFVDVIDPNLGNIKQLFDVFSINKILNNENKIEFVERINQENKEKLQINIYQDLFHKYLLGLANPNDKTKYEIIRNNISKEFKERKYYAHLHCYDISRFNEIYGEYINKISKYFSIVVTYSIEVPTINNTDFVVLKIPNKGMDIGGKFCAVAYLNDNKIPYEYILFLQSKSDPKKRKNYFEPLIQNLDDKFIENINNYDGYFPDIQFEIVGEKIKIISGNTEFSNSIWPERNLLYRKELLKYLNCTNNTNRFIEGNVYILSKDVINKLFKNPILYNILNTNSCFDYNWVQKHYKIKGNYYEVYKEFKVRKLLPHNSSSYDGSLEHVFERVVLNFCENRHILCNPDQIINLIGLKNIKVSISENLYLLKHYFQTQKFKKITLFDITNLINLNYNYAKTLFCLQPIELKQLVPQLKKFKAKPSVLWVWEFKSLPSIFKEYEKYFSKVYVQSQFCYNVFSKHLSIPIEKIDLKSPIHDYLEQIPNHKIINENVNNILQKTKDKVKYGFCFDLNSSIVRKNPLNLVKAFNNLNDETKVLILKYRPPRDNRFINKIENDIHNSFVIEIKKNKNIYCITDELEPLDLYKLYTNFNYYISPHCGEGFGLTIYDNMVLGNKIISPYYSGETEYLNRDEIIELKYEEKDIPGLREHPIYGQMKDFKAASISVESIDRGLKKSEEIYILGNGPSLKNCDFNFLKRKTTFALNSSYKKFAELNFYPTYFGCFDPKLIECHYDKFVQLMNDNNNIKKFFFLNENNKGKKQFSFQDENNSRYQKINFLPPQETYINLSNFNAFYKMHNSGATAALISILLGYKKIVLLGCDCNYVEQILESRLINPSTKTLQILETPKNNPNYWFDNYQEKGEIYSIPDGNSCHMKGWEILHQASKIHNVEIINENIESKIPYFRRSPKICFYYRRRTNANLKNTGINKICDFIFDNLSNYLNYDIIDNYDKDSDIVISTYDKFDNNYNYCRILIVYDIIYLYNKEKTDNIEQFNIIHSILSSLKKNDFIIFNSEFQRRKYLEFKDKYNFQVRKENTDILYLPYRFKENKLQEKPTKKYDFFIIIQLQYARKNPDLYEKYIEKLENFKFCIILSFQHYSNLTHYKKIYQNKNNVDVFYNCDDKKLYELILLSKYCLYLSDDEGTGLHAIECLYNNCIPIVKNNSVFNEILGNNCHYITNIYDINNSIIEINNIMKENKKILDLNLDIFEKFKIDFFCKQLKKIIYNFYNIYKYNDNFNKNNTIFILGNGRSLAHIMFDEKRLNLLKKYDTFALNAAYRKFKELDFYPTFFACNDPKLIKTHLVHFKELLHNSPIKKFFYQNFDNSKIKPFNENDLNNKKFQKINLIHQKYEKTDKYIPSEFDNFYDTACTGVNSCLFSILMGYKNIILLGCDCDYIEILPETKIIDIQKRELMITKTPTFNPNYWFDDYQREGDTYSIPSGQTNHMKAWKILHSAAEFHNVNIINCSMNSKIPFFVKKGFDELNLK